MFEKYLDFCECESRRISLIYEGIIGQGLGGIAGAAVGAATGVDMKLAGAAGGAIGGALTAKKGERLKDAAIGGLGGAAIGWGGEAAGFGKQHQTVQNVKTVSAPTANANVPTKTQTPALGQEGGPPIEKAKKNESIIYEWIKSR